MGHRDDGATTRRLQQVGSGTYTVSIPKSWAVEHGLEAGMDLHLYTHQDGSLVVRDAATDGGALATARIAINGDGPAHVERALRAAHAAGFETVRLIPGIGTDGETGNTGSDGGRPRFSDEQRRAARAVTRTLAGADLLAAQPDAIAVQHLLDPANVSIPQSLLQLQFTAQAIHEGAVAAVLDGDAGAADPLAERRAEATRLRRMVERHAIRSLVSFAEVDTLGVSRPKLFDCYVTARALELVADEGLRVARVGADLDTGLPAAVAPSVRETADLAASVVADATTAVIDSAGTAVPEQEALADCEAVHAAVEATEEALFADSPDAGTAASTVRMLDALARSADYGATVAQVALRAMVRADNNDGSGVIGGRADDEA